MPATGSKRRLSKGRPNTGRLNGITKTINAKRNKEISKCNVATKYKGLSQHHGKTLRVSGKASICNAKVHHRIAKTPIAARRSRRNARHNLERVIREIQGNLKQIQGAGRPPDAVATSYLAI